MIPAGCEAARRSYRSAAEKRRKGPDRLDGSTSAADEVSEQCLHVEDPYFIATGEIE